MRRVVIDTNIIVSSNLVASGKPAAVMKLFYLGKLQFFYSAEMLAEYKKVLGYERLKFTIERQTAIIESIEAGGILIEPPKSIITLPDESDRTFYDTAAASEAILITGNIKDYPKEPSIMTPAEFLEKVANG